MRSSSSLFVFVVVLVLLGTARADAAPLEDRLQSKLQSAVCERTGYAPANIVIKRHRTRIAPKYRAADNVTVSLPDYDDAIGPITARAHFRKNGKTLGSVPVPIRVDLFDSVLVTTRKLKRHDIIGLGDVTRDWQEITRYVKWVMTDPDSLDNCRAARTINAGSLVDRRWVETIPLVQRGDRVTLEYESGGVRVTANATAMEDGYRQQTIRVKTEYANRLIDAIVTGDGTVAPTY
ncbi:MAG: flagellar basal body P-ring formation protein FlgA [candidate division Zixibacteria bacterium]|nr:flagellar basal body P-ring formation protein FlgA [candidate division Zixibacteria bacterium]